MPFLGSDILSDTSPKPQKELAFKRGKKKKKESEHRHQQNNAKKTSTSSWILLLCPHAPLLHTTQSAFRGRERDRKKKQLRVRLRRNLFLALLAWSNHASSSLSILHSRAVVHIHHSLVEQTSHHISRFACWALCSLAMFLLVRHRFR